MKLARIPIEQDCLQLHQPQASVSALYPYIQFTREKNDQNTPFHKDLESVPISTGPPKEETRARKQHCRDDSKRKRNRKVVSKV